MSEVPFGQRVRLFRLARGLSQRQLAFRVGIHFTYLSRFETGVFPPPSEDVTVKLADALEIQPGELLELLPNQPTRWALQRRIDILEAEIAYLRHPLRTPMVVGS